MKLEELSRLLRDTDPAAVLVSRPVLDRLILNVTGVAWVVWQIPHGHCFVLDRATLYNHVEPEDLGLPHGFNLPDTVLLLERPAADELGASAGDLLGRYWRLLFHAALHRELDARLAGLTEAGLRERIEAIGPVAFEEARNTLVQDGLLTARATDREVYIEFAAYFLELRYFNPTLIAVCFPSLPLDATFEAILTRDVDAATLFTRTRLPGAPDPDPKTDDQSDESHDYYQRLERSAVRASKAGDVSSAAICYTRAARVAPGYLTIPTQEKAHGELNKLVDRLRAALKISDADVTVWKETLPRLLDKADQGARPVEAAVLYDLQRACLDHEQKIYALDVFEWVKHLGHRPLKRELAGQRFVRVPAQLRSAAHRLTAARLTDLDRKTLAALLRNALDQAELQLRTHFGPLLDTALQDAGLRPTSLPERTAVDKTVKELLDRISSAGYLSFGDVRDAIARGQMKLPDLSGPNEYYLGDPLLRLDDRLADRLDGVYRRADLYIRGLEKATAFSFGTQTGRWLTRHVTLPFGAAFLALQFVWLLVYERNVKLAREAKGPPPSFFGGWNLEPWFHATWLVLGVFLIAVIRSAALRETLTEVGRIIFRAGRFVFWEIPGLIWSSRWIRALVGSAPVQLVLNYAVRPLIVCAVLWVLPLGLWELGTGSGLEWLARAFTFLCIAGVVNTRFGWRVEVVLIEAARRILELIPSLPTALRWLNDIFRELVAALEWLLARVEDWLRLRGRTGPFAVAVRAVAGVLWMPFAFLIRFYMVVLIEPMINPLKLPLSLLFAKFVYPVLLLFPALLQSDQNSWLGYSSPLARQLGPYLTEPGAGLLIMGTLWLLPDAFTFLFWEMRENWRLYRANRPAALRPVAVGGHGETVHGLLHWGFHSGTVPRLYAKLRAAERAAARTEEWRDARTHRAALRAVEEAVRRFATRDFVEVLNDSDSGWTGPRLSAGRVSLGTNRIRLELAGVGTADSAWLEWEDRAGWLVARWASPGFLTALTDEQARVFTNALAYLHKRAGVNLVWEQVRDALPATAQHADLSPDGLLVWYGSRDSAPVLYDIVDPAAQLRPRVPGQRQPTAGPTLDSARLLFDRARITWSEWTEVWRPPATGDSPRRLAFAGNALSLLPPRTGPARVSPAPDAPAPAAEPPPPARA
ncbi:MAG: hypothetical protein ACKODX_20150 [Gemmata sp.]